MRNKIMIITQMKVNAINNKEDVEDKIPVENGGIKILETFSTC